MADAQVLVPPEGQLVHLECVRVVVEVVMTKRLVVTAVVWTEMVVTEGVACVRTSSSSLVLPPAVLGASMASAKRSFVLLQRGIAELG